MKNKKLKDNDYIFLSAMIRAREAKMLTDEKLEQALNAETAADSAKIFEECGFPDMSDMTDAEIDMALTAYRAGIFGELSERPEAAVLTDLFRLKYDYHNVKVLAKARGENLDGSTALSESGRIPSAKLIEAFISDEKSELPAEKADAMEKSVEILAQTRNPQLSDFEVDGIYLRDLMAHAESSGSEFAVKYASLIIDTVNLRSTVRALRMGKNAEFLGDALVDGGTVSKEKLCSVSPDGAELPQLFDGTLLKKAAELGAEVIVGGSMTRFELYCDDAAAEYLSGAKYVTYGAEPVLNYLAAVENGITSVRMILTGKLYGIDSAVIRERMRRSYV